jgi:hypothetical protein
MKLNALSLLLFLLPAIPSAQAAVYECQSASGPEFSDTPCPGAKVIDLPPPNVIDTDTSTQQPDSQSTDQPAAPVYTAFSILQPEDQGAVHTNTGRFEVNLALTPGLQDGNAISVSLDGTPLPTLRTSLQFDITQDEWQGAARDTTTTLHTLTATVVDPSGNPLIAAPPVQFYALRASHRR